MAKADQSLTFRPSIILRVICLLLGLGMGAFALLVFLDPFLALVHKKGDSFGDLVFPAWVTGILCSIMSALLVSTLRLVLVADADGVRWCNLVFRRHALRWEEIDRFYVGNAYNGIHLRKRDGSIATLNAVQKTNISAWLGRRTKADRVTDQLNALLRGVPPPPPPQ